jgi:hypothetical protein
MASTTIFTYGLSSYRMAVRLTAAEQRQTQLGFGRSGACGYNLIAFVIPAERTDAVRQDRLLALGARGQGSDGGFPVGAAFASALFGMLTFW